MNTSVKFVIATSVISSLILTGCDTAEKSESVPLGETSQNENIDQNENTEQNVEVAPLPTDPTGLQNEMVKSFSEGNMDRFEAAKNAYVNDVADRRVQRDFVNEIWSGSDNYEMNRELAFSIAKALSDAYDISAPTYLTGFAYWTGSGVEKDLGKTLEYWAKPGVEGNATVHYRRAMIYLDPELPYFDAVKGREIMELAANKGNEDAAKWLAEN